MAPTKEDLKAKLEEVLIEWLQTQDEAVPMIVARSVLLEIGKKVAEGDYDQYENLGD
jgi:hypothetical protein